MCQTPRLLDDCSVAVEEAVGHSNIISAAVVIFFLDEVWISSKSHNLQYPLHSSVMNVLCNIKIKDLSLISKLNVECDCVI